VKVKIPAIGADYIVEVANEATDVVDVTDFGATGASTQDATTMLQTAIDRTPVDGICYLPGPDYKVSGPLTVTKRMALKGRGPGRMTRFLPTSALSTSAVISFAPTALTDFIHAENIYLDCINGSGGGAPDSTGIYIDQCNNARFKNIRVDGADYCWDLNRVGLTNFDRCDAFNPGHAGFRLNDRVSVAPAASNVVNWFTQCVEYRTSASRDTFAGWEVLNALDIHWTSCYALRAPALAASQLWGWYMKFAAGNFGGYYFNQCESDGITDRSGANSGNSAAMYLENASKTFMQSQWASAASSGSGDTLQPALWIKGGQEIYTDAMCRFNGSSAFKLRGAPTILDLNGKVGLSATTCIDVLAGAPDAPTKVVYDLNNQSATTPITLTNDAGVLTAAMVPRVRST
jgi:hypothetical protein